MVKNQFSLLGLIATYERRTEGNYGSIVKSDLDRARVVASKFKSFDEWSDKVIILEGRRVLKVGM